MSAIDNIGDQIPNVEIDSVILEPNRVVIYLHIDEYIYRNGIGTWITREDYTNLLKIKINQFTRIFSNFYGTHNFIITSNLSNCIKKAN